MQAAIHSITFNQTEGPVGHDPSSQSGCGRYTRQNAQANMTAATPIMYGRSGAHRAIVTAPETPNRTTAHGPTQQRPMNDANTLIPIAPPVVEATFISSSITTILSQLNRWAFDSAKRAVDAAVARVWSQQFTAARTVVVKLAGICWHALARLMPTARASNHRIFIKIGHANSSLAGTTTIESVW